jgi:hypothetical protein
MRVAPDHAADAYDLDLKVWLCGVCNHVYDEKEEADECCTEFHVGDIEGERDWWAEEWDAESFASRVTLHPSPDNRRKCRICQKRIVKGDMRADIDVGDGTSVHRQCFQNLEIEPNARGLCQLCGKRINGDRVGVWIPGRYNSRNAYFHPHCVSDKGTYGAESFHADPLLDYIKQREREQNAGTVKLQGMGRMKGTKAEDVRVGDVLLWNQGGSSQVLSITPKGKKSLLWKTRTADNREWERTVRKNRLVVVSKPNSYTAKKYHAESFAVEYSRTNKRYCPTCYKLYGRKTRGADILIHDNGDKTYLFHCGAHKLTVYNHGAESYVRRDERHLRPYQRSGLAFGGIVACKQENCPHGHCPRCGNCDDVLDNDGDGSEDDDNPMFCGACGESFSAESYPAESEGERGEGVCVMCGQWGDNLFKNTFGISVCDSCRLDKKSKRLRKYYNCGSCGHTEGFKDYIKSGGSLTADDFDRCENCEYPKCANEREQNASLCMICADNWRKEHSTCPNCLNSVEVCDKYDLCPPPPPNTKMEWGRGFAESFQAPLFPKRKLRRSLRNACERCGDEGYRKSGISNTQCERCNRWVHNCCLLPSHDQHGEDVVSCQDCAENFASAVLPPAQTEGIIDAVMMSHYMQQRSILEQEVRYLEQELLGGRITRKQFAIKLLELENRFSSEEEPKRKGIVRYMRGVPVKPRKLNGDIDPAEAAKKIDIAGKELVESIEVEWDSDNKPEAEDPFSEVKWEAESMKKVGEHRVGRVTVEECVDVRADKADAVGRYYRIRFRDPVDFENFRVPAWASRAANTIGRKYYDVLGSKITMGQTPRGEWKIQSVMVPLIPRLTPDGALVIANHIQDRIEREGQWAKADCQDKERVLLVG